MAFYVPILTLMNRYKWPRASLVVVAIVACVTMPIRASAQDKNKDDDRNGQGDSSRPPSLLTSGIIPICYGRGNGDPRLVRPWNIAKRSVPVRRSRQASLQSRQNPRIFPLARPVRVRRLSSPAAPSRRPGVRTTPVCWSSPKPAMCPRGGRAAPASVTPAKRRCWPVRSTMTLTRWTRRRRGPSCCACPDRLNHWCWTYERPSGVEEGHVGPVSVVIQGLDRPKGGAPLRRGRCAGCRRPRRTPAGH